MSYRTKTPSLTYCMDGCKSDLYVVEGASVPTVRCPVCTSTGEKRRGKWVWTRSAKASKDHAALLEKTRPKTDEHPWVETWKETP